MNLTISPNMNTKKHPSFGLIHIIKPGNGWVVSVEKNRELDEVHVEGFKSFVSKHARGVVQKVRDLDQNVLKPKFYGDFKDRLLLILQEVSQKRPAFHKDDLKEVRTMLDNPNPDFKLTSDELIFGDIYK